MIRIKKFKVRLVSDGSFQAPRDTIEYTEDAVSYFFSLLAGLPHEEIHVLYLNTAYKVLGSTRVAQGGIDGCVVSTGEVFRGAIIANAAAIILAHNHPSGDPTPSESDVVMTANIRAAGEVLGISVIDHLVVCPEQMTWMVVP